MLVGTTSSTSTLDRTRVRRFRRSVLHALSRTMVALGRSCCSALGYGGIKSVSAWVFRNPGICSVLLSFLCYANTLTAGFVYDDAWVFSYLILLYFVIALSYNAGYYVGWYFHLHLCHWCTKSGASTHTYQSIDGSIYSDQVIDQSGIDWSIHSYRSIRHSSVWLMNGCSNGNKFCWINIKCWWLYL